MKKIIASLILVLTLIACSSDVSNRSTKDFFSAFLNEKTQIFAFGSAELNTILNKSDYANQPKIGAFLKSPIATLKNSLNLDNPSYYAVEGPFNNGNPSAVYIFLEVKNADSLRATLTKNGFDLQNRGKMDYLQDGDMSLGIENKLAIIVIKKEKYEGSKMLAQAFEKSKGEVSTGKVSDILNKKSDIVLGMSVSSLYETSNTDLKNLPKDKQDELRAMLKDSYIENLVHFENGEVIFETKNYFSSKLKSELFFESNSSSPIVGKLGQGTPRFGFSMNLNMKKMQKFVDSYSPDALDALSEQLGGPFTMAMFAAGGDMSQIFNGQFGFVMMGDPGKSEAMIPDFNFHVGLAGKGKTLGELAKTMLEESFSQVVLSKDGLSGFSSTKYGSSPTSKLSLPMGCEGFGKKSITAFINLDGMDMSGFELEREAKLIELIKYATFEYDGDGGRLVLKAKNGKENVLKQSVQKIIQELESEIAGFGM